MKKMRYVTGMLAALGIVFFTGCQDMNNVDNLSDQNGKLIIRITDAPFPIGMIDEASVTISRVEIRKLSEGEELGYPFITVWEGSETFDLMELRNGISAELVELEVESGKYDLIRLYVDEASLAVIGGDTYSLKVPSGAQTGIKLFMEPPLLVTGGYTADVLLDFNLERSFILKGNADSPAGIKGFNFKPVIRAVNNSTAGSIEGMVINSDTALESASVVLEQVVEQDTLEISTALTDDVGYYAMPGIPAGSYLISATLTGFDTVIVEDLEVIERNITIQDFTLTKLDEGDEEEDE